MRKPNHSNDEHDLSMEYLPISMVRMSYYTNLLISGNEMLKRLVSPTQLRIHLRFDFDLFTLRSVLKSVQC